MNVASDTNAAVENFLTASKTGKAWWFLGGLAILRNPGSAPRTPVLIEMRFPMGANSPLHTHANIDDTFYVLEGEAVFRCGDDTFLVRTGDLVCLPRGKPYTFYITGSEGARFLMVHNGDSFMSLVEELGTPATELRLPRRDEFNADPEAVMRLCEKHQMSVMGPALSEEEARDFLDRLAGE